MPNAGTRARTIWNWALSILVATCVGVGFYAAYLMPQVMGKPVRSPNGQYTAVLEYRGWVGGSDPSLRVTGAKGVCERTWTHARRVGDIRWSPDSTRIAIGRMGDTQTRLRIAPLPHGDAVCVVPYVLAVYDLQTGHSVRVGRDMALDRCFPDGTSVTWEWLNRETIICTAVCRATNGFVTDKWLRAEDIVRQRARQWPPQQTWTRDIIRLDVRDTSSGLRITESPIIFRLTLGGPR